MHPMRFLLMLVVVSAPCAGAPVALDLLLRDVTVIDVRDGTRHAHRDIAVRDGRIVAIAEHAALPALAARRTIEGNGRFAIPGLWDMHVHFGGGEALIGENRSLLPLYVAHGITAVRDAAGDLGPSVLQWRARIAAGELLGPTLFTSGPKIEGVGSIWPGDLEVATSAELDAALDQLQRWNVDFIKITDNALSPQLFLEALRETQARGLTSSAHIPLGVTVLQASSAGLDSIEHIAYAYKAGVPAEAELAARHRAGSLSAAALWDAVATAFDADTARAAYRRLADAGTAVVPTLNGSRITAYLDQDDHADDEYLYYIGPGLQATYAWRVERAAADDAAAITRRQQRFEAMAAILPLLQDAGVTILAGTDAGFLNSFNYPGIGLHEELALFVRYGLTPLQALQAATLNAARFLGQEDTHGQIAEGKAADLVLLDADPLADIAATRRIAVVVLRGTAYEREALDAMLEGVRAQVAAQR